MPPTNVRINKENDRKKIITSPSSPDKRARRQSMLATPLYTKKLATNDDWNIEEELMDYDDYIIDQEKKNYLTVTEVFVRALHAITDMSYAACHDQNS